MVPCTSNLEYSILNTVDFHKLGQEPFGMPMFPPFSSMNSSCPPLLSPPTMSDSADRAVLPPEGALRAYPSQEMAALQHLESPKPNIKTNNDVRKTCQSSFNAHAKNIQKHHRAATLQSVSISNPTHTQTQKQKTRFKTFKGSPQRCFFTH